jgi:hypothetical protein
MSRELKTMKERSRSARVFVAVIEALALSLVLLYFGEYFGWHWVREAGGLGLKMVP